jgi:hypothetical protein
MPGGYPNKIARTSLGPTYVNANKIANPQQEIDANILNLMCWQVSGMNGCTPRAIIIGQADNTQAQFLKQWLSWDPDGLLGPSTITRTGTGAYIWALPGTGTYPDMNGNAVVFQADFVFAFALGSTGRNLQCDLDTDGNSGTMYCFLTGSSIDIGSAGLFKKFMLVII